MGGWMLYGANGYTGRLIAELARDAGEAPVLAGRRASEIEEMGARLGMETRVFELANLERHLDGVSTLLLAAGPFSVTSGPAVRACLLNRVNYLDITGEVTVFQELHGLRDKAVEAGIVIMPGVGFDVVPSDCVAATLAQAMPDATHLELAFSGGEFSKGTTKTMLTHIGDGGAIREGGVIKRVPVASKERRIAFRDKDRHCASIPWGDVATAYYSTGIPNIVVYTAGSPKRSKQMRMIQKLGPVLTWGPVQKALFKLVDKKVAGPGAEARASHKTQLWGEVRNAKGETISAQATTPEGYSLTATTALESTRRICELKPGYYTPSMAFGAGFLEGFEGCELVLNR